MIRNSRTERLILSSSLLLLLFAIQTARAQEQSPSSTSSTSSPSPRITGFTLSPENYQRAKDYSNQKYLREFAGSLWAFVVLILLLILRVGPRLRDWAERISTKRFLQGLLYSPVLIFLVALLGLPTDAWSEQLERTYGLSVQSWSSWTSDWLKNQAIGLVLGTGLVLILYAVVRRSPRRWWFYFWLASLPVLVFVIFLAPLVIEPMFFKFEPLAQKQPVLVTELEKMIARGGISIPAERMFEMNASTKTTGLNAYVSGFGASKRVVVWDNTIAKATIPQILYVFGHEMGHYVLLHIPKELAIDSLVLLVLFYLGYRAVLSALARWGTAWGIRGVEDWASLPALLVVIGLLFFLATPAFNTVSRHFEHEADRYGLEVIHGIVPDGGQIAARYFQTSGELNLADPDPNPLINAWFFDHPSRKERVDFVVNYDPWSKGEQPVYVK